MEAPRSAVIAERLARLTDLSIETAVVLLKSSRTRAALHVLSASDPPLPLDQLASDVAAFDADRSRDSTRVALVHVTLPKLEDHGLLEYELRSGTVHLSGPLISLDDPLVPVPDGDGLESIDSRDRRR